jgi:signal transduction histidine kinase
VDPFRIEQVILNLVTNAVKYGDGKSVTIRIFKDQKRVFLKVEDQGPGIAPEHQERIFERFERATNSTRTSGLGLGLYISRQIVEAHGGSIRVESKLHRGSTFTVELPA